MVSDRDKEGEITAKRAAEVRGKEEKGNVADGIAGKSGGRGEITATTIGRMLGLVTLSEFQVMESKIELLATRVNNLVARVDRAIGLIQKAPTGNDLDRIDAQIAALRTMIGDALSEITTRKITEIKEVNGEEEQLEADNQNSDEKRI